MRHVVLVGLFCLAPVAARADIIMGASVGSGVTVKPEIARTPTNIMLAPGWGLGEMLRLELGIVADLGDVEASKFDLGVRPMLVIDPPVLPLHGRLIVGASNLLDDPVITYGGAIGIGGSIAGLGLYLEVGVLPKGDAETVAVEGRVGGFLAFD
jgi:hypothetical protein